MAVIISAINGEGVRCKNGRASAGKDEKPRVNEIRVRGWKIGLQRTNINGFAHQPQPQEQQE
jgi:hypothetical protein